MNEVNDIKEILKTNRHLVHGRNIIDRYKNTPQDANLNMIIRSYHNYIIGNNIEGWTDDIINRRTILLNKYYNFLHENNFDNIYSAQGKFRPSILEEFIYILFRDYIKVLRVEYGVNDDKIGCGQVKAYTNLFFRAKNFKAFVDAPQIGINVKDQDFAIYRKFELTVNDSATKTIMVPAVAVEAKTFIDKTMLDSIIATAEKLKDGNPYTRFIAVAEQYDVGKDVDPAYSRIDQIYILRKCSRRDLKLDWRDIDVSVVTRLFKEVKSHVERPWSDIEERLNRDGVIL